MSSAVSLTAALGSLKILIILWTLSKTTPKFTRNSSCTTFQKQWLFLGLPHYIIESHKILLLGSLNTPLSQRRTNCHPTAVHHRKGSGASWDKLLPSHAFQKTPKQSLYLQLPQEWTSQQITHSQICPNILLAAHYHKVYLWQLAQHLSETDHHGLRVEQHSNTRAGWKFHDARDCQNGRGSNELVPEHRGRLVGYKFPSRVIETKRQPLQQMLERRIQSSHARRQSPHKTTCTWIAKALCLDHVSTQPKSHASWTELAQALQSQYPQRELIS